MRRSRWCNGAGEAGGRVHAGRGRFDCCAGWDWDWGGVVDDDDDDVAVDVGMRRVSE